MRFSFFLFALLSVVFFSSCLFRERVPLVVHHARIYTVDKEFSVAEALAVSDGKILAIGSNDEILKKYHGEQDVNAHGKAIFPGFTDAHCHFSGYATDSWKLDLVGTASWNDIVDSLQKYAQRAPMEWLYGRGWDQNDWENKSFPNKAKLDSLYPTRPVYLKRIDGHAAIANQYALDLAGITPQTKIAGGDVEVIDGKLTGILVDNAMNLVEAKVPEIADSLALKYYEQLAKKCFSFGLTSVHDCGVSEHTVERLKNAQSAGILPLKIAALLYDDPATYDRWVAKGRTTVGDITVAGYKVYADGALGSRGACLVSPYHDKPGWYGFLLSDTAHFSKLAEKLAGTNLQMCTHAIGDSANRTILKTYAKVLKAGNDKRWRIEHAQVVQPDDYKYFAEYAIVPSVQPTHATSDMYWAGDRLGTTVKDAYAYHRLMQQNGWLALGTDFPVEDIDPFKTFYAAVVRKDSKGFPAGGFQPDEALSRKDAIRGMTIWAAKSMFQEKKQGSLEKGKAADFIMLNTDLMTCDESKILQAKVLATYINGRPVFKAQ